MKNVNYNPVKGSSNRSHEIKFSPVCFQRLCNFKNFPEPGEKKKFRFVPIFSVLGKSSARVHREENLSWNEPEVFELWASLDSSYWPQALAELYKLSSWA